ncbi:hypothetical protein GWK47_042654 [Chionoecetes opilio]|uniref:Uncharacterized protein n=1 Tax=Chionoecetes opilio TaxID=41210 RepID=A0A8J4YFW6_CHIOP|nr:hypothetical protein GWK47_042654 [Chionoecetes opilio]
MHSKGAKKYKAGIRAPHGRVFPFPGTGGARGKPCFGESPVSLVTLPGAAGCGYVMCQRGGGVARSTPNITSLGVWRTMRAALPSRPLSSPPTCRLGGGGRAGPQGGGQRANAVHAE